MKKIKEIVSTEAKILEQKKDEIYNIERCKIFGFMRPRLFFDGNFSNDINIKIYTKGKVLFDKDYSYKTKKVAIIQNLSLFSSKIYIDILNKKKKAIIIRYVINNSVFVKFINKVHTILKLIYKALRVLWKKHHFMVPPKMWGFYFRKLKEKIQFEESSIVFLDPFVSNEYNEWLLKHEVIDEVRKQKYNPLISIVVPVYNVPIKYLEECIDSVLNQNYSNWELCLVDDCSTNEDIKPTLEKYEKMDKRIKVHYRKENGRIAEATNTGFKMAKGEFIGLLDNDDVLTVDALYEVVKVLNSNRKVDFIYSDEDKLNLKYERCEPYFKSDWSPDTFMSNNYLCHFSVFRKSLLDKVGGERSEYDGAQDFDLFLRLTEEAKEICHISKILYHWRIIPGSTSDCISAKSYAVEAGRKAVESALKRRKIIGTVDSNGDGTYIVNYKIKNPLVSIIIPTKDYADTLEICLNSIYKKSTYKNFEIIVVDNNSKEQKTFDLFEKYKNEHNNFKVIRLECDFNYSYLNNEAVKVSKGDYILLLNNDTEIITEDWLEKMIGYAQLDHVGTVGVKLYYPDNTIQHGGTVLGINGVASHAYVGYSRDFGGYFGKLKAPCNYAANTAACLMISKKKFTEVNGLDEKLKVNYNDVDFNIKLLDKGYYNVFLPNVELYHFESKSRGLDIDKKKYNQTLEEIKYIQNKWDKFLKNDPFYNKNYSRNSVYKLEK
ncbi:MAG: glycosyltransferase [Bacilli bacterium]